MGGDEDCEGWVMAGDEWRPISGGEKLGRAEGAISQTEPARCCTDALIRNPLVGWSPRNPYCDAGSVRGQNCHTFIARKNASILDRARGGFDHRVALMYFKARDNKARSDRTYLGTFEFVEVDFVHFRQGHHGWAQ